MRLLILTLLLAVSSNRALAFCFLNCETPEQTQTRLAAEAERRRFLETNDIGRKKFYVYDESQLAKDSALGWHVILVVDRSARGQTLKIYLDGQLRETWPVSTALEDYKARPYSRAEFVTTPLGRFIPRFQKKKYRSLKWGVEMPFAIFFTDPGIAFHATVGRRAELALGHRESAGCVHLSPENAAALYDLVKENFRQTLVVIYEASDDTSPLKKATDATPI